MKTFLKIIGTLVLLIVIAGVSLYALDFYNVYHFQVGDFKISDINKLWNKSDSMKKLEIGVSGADQGQNGQSQSQAQTNLVASPLNGQLISQERAQMPVVAVMIENSPPARQQSGLDKADVVYETLAEGGITRFMALFQNEDVLVVGPVRSARSYFVEIVREYNAWYAHVGGSADGIKLIAKYGLHDLDQFFVDKPYWRDSNRVKTRGFEHGMYVSILALRDYVKGQAELGSFESWGFKDDAPVSNLLQSSTQTSTQAAAPAKAVANSAQTISVNFSFPSFLAQWKYDSVKNVYNRSNGGVAHVDAQSGQQLFAKNIIVQYVKMTPILNNQKGDDSALKLDLIGSGDGVLFLDGQMIPITWKKAKSGDHTQFYYADGAGAGSASANASGVNAGAGSSSGQKIQLNRGVTWVELAEKGKVSYK
ncbi:MAG: DUF3048 domain-containing protein [Candidatus Gracilibacteria bacterium]|jgi:hypothetical protein